MSNLFASVFTGFGAFLAGMFGGHFGLSMNASTTPPATHERPAPWMASTTPGMGGMMAMMRNGVFGTVTAVDGTTITVEGREGTTTATTTYEVDASNAKIIKGSATSTASVSDISVGDHVAVEGTVNSDDSVTATTIIDGRVMGMMMGGGRGMRGMGSTTPPWMGGMGSTTRQWNNGASSTPGMHHPTPGIPPGVNPGGPMIPAGAGGNVHAQGQAGMQGGPGVNVNANVGGGIYSQ